jgi:hypothetical protein
LCCTSQTTGLLDLIISSITSFPNKHLDVAVPLCAEAVHFLLIQYPGYQEGNKGMFMFLIPALVYVELIMELSDKLLTIKLNFLMPILIKDWHLDFFHLFVKWLSRICLLLQLGTKAGKDAVKWMQAITASVGVVSL